ncbi:unnamed protein product [Trichobilharzia regenti]|nr:unnamed protein product [Trichobilharzia regenti]
MKREQAFGSGSSLKEYISDGWNKLDCLAISLYIIGLSVKIHAYQNRIQEQLYELETNKLLQYLNLSSLTMYNQTNIYNLLNSCHIDQCYNNNNLTSIPVNLSTEQIHIINSMMEIKALPMFSGSGHSSHRWSPDLPYYILSDDLFTISRILFAFSLFAFYVRLMYIFSFSIVLGPKLIMINRMVSSDSFPSFMWYSKHY